MTEDRVFIDIYKDNQIEKIEKYGDPNKNFLITATLILFIAGLVVIFLGKQEIGGITEDYSDYYPQSTTAYIDIDLNHKNIQEINLLTSLNIKNLPDLLVRIFDQNYKTKKRKAIEKLLNQVIGDEISFGTWNHKGIDRSLVIFPIKREGNINSLFKLLSGKNEKLISITYKGIRIITTKDRKAAFLISRERLFASDSYDALVFILNSYILHDAASLYDRKDVKKAITYVDKNRFGTILLANSSSGNELLNKITENRFSYINGSIPTTAISMMVDKNLFYLKSYTPYDELNISDNNIKKAFLAILNKKNKEQDTDFLPGNTIYYFNINGLKNYINLYLELSNIRTKPEFNQFKQFIKMFTSLDFDNDIMEFFSKSTIFATVDSGNSRPACAVIMSLTPKTEPVISKFVKLLQMQIPSVKISKVYYRSRELNTISSSELPAVLYYGKVSNLYILGDTFAVKSVIDTINSKKSFLNTKMIRDFKKHSIYNSGITAFMNIQGINKYNLEKKAFPEKDYFDKINYNVKSAFITADYKDDIFISSIQFRLNDNLSRKLK